MNDSLCTHLLVLPCSFAVLLDQLKHGFMETLQSDKLKSKELSMDFEAQFTFSKVEALTASIDELTQHTKDTQVALNQLKAPFVQQAGTNDVPEAQSSQCGSSLFDSCGMGLSLWHA